MNLSKCENFDKVCPKNYHNFKSHQNVLNNLFFKFIILQNKKIICMVCRLHPI